jgi:phage gp29-like protein
MVNTTRTSPILDVNGQNIKINEALSDEQTSRLGSIASEYANHPSRGLTPGKLARILAAAEQGDLTQQNDLFEDMEEKDGHIHADISKRKRAIIGLPWQIDPPRNANTQEQKAAEQLKEWLEDMHDFEDNLLDIADAIGKGYSMHSLDWRDWNGILMPKLNFVEQRYFTLDKKDRNKLLLRTEGGDGEPLWEFGWVAHVHKAKSGGIGRAALFRILAWSYLFKNYSVRDLAEFLEIYGIPARLGKYPPGASDGEKHTLLRAVTGIGHSAAGIIPDGMEIDFKEAAKGMSDPFQFMINWCESVQSKVILGGTLTSTAENTGLGSNLGDVHNEIRKDLLVSDAKQIAGTLNRDLLWPIIALNIPGVSPDRAPRFKFVTEEDEALNERAERDEKLFGMGYQLTQEKVDEVYGEGYERIQNTNQTTEAAAEDDKAGIAAAKAGDDKPEQMDGVVVQLAEQTQSEIDGIYTKIKQLLDEVADQGGTLEDFQDRLIETYEFLEPDALADVVQLGLALSDIAGRYEVQENE